MSSKVIHVCDSVALCLLHYTCVSDSVRVCLWQCDRTKCVLGVSEQLPTVINGRDIKVSIFQPVVIC